jgi:hypothetical protein
MVFREDVTGRGVTHYIGGKKLINLFRVERPDVMCYANPDDGRLTYCIYF